MKKTIKISVVTFILMLLVFLLYEKKTKKDIDLKCFMKEKIMLCGFITLLIFLYQETLTNKKSDISEYLHTQAFDSFKQ